MNTSPSKPFKKTNHIFWRSLLAMLIAVAIYGYLFYSLKVSGNDTASLQAQINTLQGEESEVGALKLNLAATEQSQQTLASYFVDVNNPVPFFETIEGYGKDTNVTTKFDSVAVKQNPTALTATLTADGSFADLYRFIAVLEAAPYEFTITSADIAPAVPMGLQPSGTGAHSSGWEAHIEISVASVTGATAATQ